MITNRQRIYNVSDKDFIKIIEQSFSYAECCRLIGIKGYRNQKVINIIKERANKLQVSTKHFCKQKAANEIKTMPLNEILIEKSTYTNNSRLKERLVKEGLLEYKCAVCGNSGYWNGKSLTLQLDHINENHLDNRLENLQFLCPNCHAQKTAGV